MLYLLLLLQVQVPPPDSADVAGLRHRNGTIPRSATAVFAPRAPRIDGRLDDPAWALATPETGFRRDVPSDGKPATQDTEVRVLYDRDALYIGARLHDDRPDRVSRRLNRRDSFGHFNDVFFALIDSYHDHRTQFVFGVTPAGERRDAIATGDGLGEFDAGWDPVWEAKTTIDSLGWTAEFRIPFSQLRFSRERQQIWGIQFRRDILRAGEAVDWQWSPKTEPGQVSKYGHLLGLEDIPAPRRLELQPWALSQARLTQGVAPGNPFDGGAVGSATGGLDLKYGLSSGLTLTATINPDFGQVEADPSVVNLTAFETFFEERRPFFVEGANLFNFGSGGMRTFYSRRVGRAPGLSAAGTATYVDEPTATSILGAVKLTGRTASGWSIGVVDAMTGREYARLADQTGGSVRRVPIEPRANYAVVRVKRDLAGGSSGFGFMATAVNRDIDPEHFASIRRSAYFAGADFFHRWRRNTFQLTGTFGVSRIAGEPLAIALAQTASARYFQRPDQSYVRFDPTRTALSGAIGEVVFRKQGGNWVYWSGAGFGSPGFDVNDAGFLPGVDRLNLAGGVGRQWLRPGRLARQATAEVSLFQSRNFGGVRLNTDLNGSTSLQFHDFSSLRVHVARRFAGLDDQLTRGGPLVRPPGVTTAALGYGTDSRRAVAGSANGTLRWDGAGGADAVASVNLTLQTRRGASLSLGPSYQRVRSPAFYVGAYDDPTAGATFGRRYVFADLAQDVLSLTARLNYYFTPGLSLQLYAQPFVATADFGAPKALVAPRTYQFTAYGQGGSTIVTDPATGQITVDADGDGPAPALSYANPDFRRRSLRSNVVLRWEYRPGSTLFLVWNQGRSSQIGDPRFRPLRDLGGIFGDDMQNVFLAKATYYFAW